MSSVSLVNAPQDAGTADYLASDLGRQGVAVARGAGGSGPLLLVVGPASSGDSELQAAAVHAVQAGRPLHVVRLGDGRLDWPVLGQAASWTDAFGNAAQANVAALAARLRDSAGPAPSPWGAPPPAAPSIWTNPPAPTPAPPPSLDPFRPAPPPFTGASEPSDKGSLIALGLISTLGLVLLILYLTGMLGPRTGTPVASPAAPAAGTAGAVTDQWLTGTWKENCAAREFIRLDLASGAVTFHNGAGRVARNGNALTITGGGGSILMTVGYLGPDQMSATAQGDTQTLYRCG